MINACIGIPNWLPDNTTDRLARINRLNNLVRQIKEFFNLPIIFIAQNWKDFTPEYSGQLHIYRYDKLGILKARQLLRDKFLDLNYDYIIMFDDDAIIECAPGQNKAYLDSLEQHPNGFCFIKGHGSSPYVKYADSELNLCAISKFIYKNEPIPNIDPQKDEGFEDRVWSTLLHFKYSEYEFDAPSGIRSAHFKNQELIKQGKEVKSTWAQTETHNWYKLRASTTSIEHYIARTNELPDKIDLVVPYVDATDKNWQDLFNKHNPNKNTQIESVNAINRFRSQGDFFRFFFRCIDKNLPWINKIHLLVQSDSQVPNWINRKKVHIVYHNEFIPKKFLPTFNSCTIEMFLQNIPELAEKFIYVNDDVFFLKYIEIADLFEKNYVKENFQTKRYSGMYGQHCDNSFNLIFKDDGRPFIRPDHEPKPYFKNQLRKCYNQYKNQIDNSISSFRAPTNYNCYIYSLYQAKKDIVLPSNIISGYAEKFDVNTLNSSAVICLNDVNPVVDIYNDPNLSQWFLTKFKSKSMYELNDFQPAIKKQKEVIKKDIRADGSKAGYYLYF